MENENKESQAPSRKLEDVQKDYNLLAFHSGQKVYAVKILGEEISQIQEQMRKLSQEGADLMKKEEQKKSEEQPKAQDGTTVQ